jgi:hypothetical protein
MIFARFLMWPKRQPSAESAVRRTPGAPPRGQSSNVATVLLANIRPLWSLADFVAQLALRAFAQMAGVRPRP